MTPLTRFRDWWHRPLLDRLDAIEAVLQRPQIAVKGVRREDVEEIPPMTSRGFWSYSMPQSRP